MRLTVAVNKTFGMPVTNTAQAKKLSDAVYERTKLSLNYNTIRRYFGIVKNNTEASLFTLDTFSKYVGCADWDGFCNQDFIHELSLFVDFVNYSTLKGPIDLKKLEYYSDKFGDQTVFLSGLKQLMLVASTRKEYKFFEAFFIHSRNVFLVGKKNDVIEMTNVWGIIQYLSILIKTCRSLQKVAVSNYSKLQFVDNYFVEFCPDLDNINGYYGKLLDRYIKHKKDRQAYLFYNCMKFYGCYFSKTTSKYDLYYNRIAKVTEFDGIYNIPIARKRVCEALYLNYKKRFNENEFLQQIEADLQYLKKRGDLFDHITAYVTHLSQGLYWCGHYNIIKSLTEKYFLNTEVNIGYHATDDWNDLKIYYAVSLFKSGEKLKAKVLLKQVESFRFRPSQFSITSNDYKKALKICQA